MSKRKLSLAYLADQIAYTGFRRQEYESVRQSVYARNHQALLRMSLLGAVLIAGLVVTTYFIPHLETYRPAYFTMLAALLVIYILAKTVAVKNNRLTMPLVYVCLSCAYAFGIALGTFLQPEVPATAFPVLLFALPLLLTDKPYRCSLLLVAATAVFCVASSQLKPADISRQDIMNAISFCIFSIACNRFVMHTKISDLVSRRCIEYERDTDGLTKLLNRTAGQKAILEYISRGRETAILIMLDIDKFKSINDVYGHAVGDDAIRLFGQSIRETFRQSDILVRCGGDEFLVFMPYVLDRDCVKRRIDSLRTSIDQHGPEYVNVPRMTFSAGVSIYPHDANAYNELLKMADDALYFSKHSDNTVSFYRDCFGNGKQSRMPAEAD